MGIIQSFFAEFSLTLFLFVNILALVELSHFVAILIWLTPLSLRAAFDMISRRPTPLFFQPLHASTRRPSLIATLNAKSQPHVYHVISLSCQPLLQNFTRLITMVSAHNDRKSTQRHTHSCKNRICFLYFDTQMMRVEIANAKRIWETDIFSWKVNSI